MNEQTLAALASLFNRGLCSRDDLDDNDCVELFHFINSQRSKDDDDEKPLRCEADGLRPEPA